jgi:hypothetical protein
MAQVAEEAVIGPVDNEEVELAEATTPEALDKGPHRNAERSSPITSFTLAPLLKEAISMRSRNISSTTFARPTSTVTISRLLSSNAKNSTSKSTSSEAKS